MGVQQKENKYQKIHSRGSKPDIMLGQAMVLKSVFNNFPIFRPILSAAGNPYLRITYLQKLTFGNIHYCKLDNITT